MEKRASGDIKVRVLSATRAAAGVTPTCREDVVFLFSNDFSSDWRGADDDALHSRPCAAPVRVCSDGGASWRRFAFWRAFGRAV